MPRNSAGVYSLPSGYKVASGDTIVISQHNPPLEDIAQALTDSLCADGRNPMTGLLTLSGDATANLNPVTYRQFTAERAAAAITGGSISGVTLSALAAKFTAGFSRSAVLSPAQITANQNDYAPTQASAPTTLDAASVLRLTSDAARTITGLVAPTTNAEGREVRIANIGTFPLTLAAESASSTAANRFALGGDMEIMPGGAVTLAYDATSSRWRPIDRLKLFGTAAGNALLLDASAKVPAANTKTGTVIASSMVRYTATTSLSTVLPADNTIPQVSEGTQILSATITPSSSSSKIRARFVGPVSAAAAIWATAALFIDGAANAVAGTVTFLEVSTRCNVFVIEYEWTPGDTSAHTVTVRVGPGVSNSIQMNNATGFATLGGVFASTLVLEEVLP